MESLVYGLQRTTKLLYLNLSKNMVSDKGAALLGTILLTFHTSLRTLKMKRCGLTDEGARPLFEAFIR